MEKSTYVKKLADKGNFGQIVAEMTLFAEEEKRRTSGAEQQYWQGRADMGRIIHALAFDGLRFGLRSGNSATMFTEMDHDVIDYIVNDLPPK